VKTNKATKDVRGNLRGRAHHEIPYEVERRTTSKKQWCLKERMGKEVKKHTIV
jgi:hypothetical protein